MIKNFNVTIIAVWQPDVYWCGLPLLQVKLVVEFTSDTISSSETTVVAGCG